jgi:hypothetical protein
MDQHVYVWEHTGELMDGWPVYCRDVARDSDDDDQTESQGARIVATPAVGDIDDDGEVEIVVGTNEVYESIESRIYIMHWDGNNHEGGPFEWADPDADTAGPARNFALVGEVLPVVGQGIPTAITLADIDFDGLIEFAAEGVGGQPVMRLRRASRQSRLHGHFDRSIRAVVQCHRRFLLHADQSRGVRLHRRQR